MCAYAAASNSPPPHQVQLSVDIVSCAIPLVKGPGCFALLPRVIDEDELCSGTLRQALMTDVRLSLWENPAVYRNPIREKALLKRLLCRDK